MIGLAEAKLARAKRLVTTGSGTTISVSDLEIELEGMRRRRAAVSDIRTTPETLTPPADGVIASSRVVAGQVVQGQDILSVPGGRPPKPLGRGPGVRDPATPA